MPHSIQSLGHVLSDGSIHYVDMDLNCPTFKTSDVDSYNGSLNDYRDYLMSSLILMWLDEKYKLEGMESAGGPDAVRSVRVKKVNRRKALASKVGS